MRKSAAHFDGAVWARSLTLLGFALLARPAARADSSLRFGGVPVELTISQVSRRAVRLQLTPMNAQGDLQIEAPSPVLVPFPTVEKLQTRTLDGAKELRVGQLRVTIQSPPLTISVRRPDGTLVQKVVFGGEDGKESISFRTAAPVLGLGEGGPQFDRRGRFYPLRNGEGTPLLATDGARIQSPFLIGVDGWALFLCQPAGEFDLRGGQGRFRPQRQTPSGLADVFVIDARKPADAMREFVRLTGKPVLPPKWAFGYMQSHRTLSSEAAIFAEARTFRQKKLPCDTFIFLGTGFCPAGWNLGHDSFQFNTNIFFDKPAAFIRKLHAEHLHVVLHVVPLERKYPALHGRIPPAPGEILDAQDIGTYWNRHRALFADGVDGWWADEGDWFDVASRLARCRMYYEGPLRDRPNVRPWDLQRNGCPGISRFGGWIWSGDIRSSWKTLAAQIAVGLNFSLSISPYWGTDIGGFYPARDGEFTGELYARWFEFAAFCPLFRSHGRNWWLHRPWGWDTGEVGPIEARPVPKPSELHNAAVEPICRKYDDLRYQLLPYTYTLARQAYDTGLPLMRALWLEYPHDPEAAKLGSEYLWGPDLLIAPVTEKGAKVWRVYLPAGRWFDWWTHAEIRGGRWIVRPVNLGTMPIYARAGAIIPLAPVRQYIAQPVSGPTLVRVFPGADGEFTLYDDDGRSLDYLHNSDPKMVWIRFHWNDRTRRFDVTPDPRMKQWPGGVRFYKVQLVGSGAEPRQIEFRGKPVQVNL